MDTFAHQINADELRIDTPELVSIEMAVAGIGSRFVAVTVDYLIWGVAFVLLVIAASLILPSLHTFARFSENWAVGLIFLLIFLFHWGYFALFEGLDHGRTPGKRIARIRVIHCSGRSISFVESLARNLVRAIDYLPGVYGVGIVAIFCSRRHQRLGDMVAGTLVVRDSRTETPHWGEMGTRTITAHTFITAPPASPSLESSQNPLMNAPHLSVSLPASAVQKLSISDLEVLEGFFARRLDMELSTRAALAARMATALRSKSGLEMPEGVSDETFLEAVAHHLREQAWMG
jgi:uncharacterized RDD family membrane protein YckC